MENGHSLLERAQTRSSDYDFVLKSLQELQYDPVRVPEINRPAFPKPVFSGIKSLRFGQKLHAHLLKTPVFPVDVLYGKA